LAAPQPFARDPIADADNKITQNINGPGDALAYKLQQHYDLTDEQQGSQNAQQIHEPGKESADWPGEQLRKHDPFRRANEERAGFHNFGCFRARVEPAFARNRISKSNSTKPKAIFAE